MLQVGTRNMQNFNLLRAVGKIDKPVLLKRGLAATLKEFLMAAEYIMSEGNHKVILCERGIRTFCNYTRNTLDLNIVPVLKKETHLPVIVDPSHGTGRYDLINPMSKAAIAAGADGLMIEVHPNPEEATSDGDQSLTPASFSRLMEELKLVAKAVGRTL
jgi:3-deoxy-7-phosphoheptulonate synthase